MQSSSFLETSSLAQPACMLPIHGHVGQALPLPLQMEALLAAFLRTLYKVTKRKREFGFFGFWATSKERDKKDWPFRDLRKERRKLVKGGKKESRGSCFICFFFLWLPRVHKTQGLFFLFYFQEGTNREGLRKRGLSLVYFPGHFGVPFIAKTQGCKCL